MRRDAEGSEQPVDFGSEHQRMARDFTESSGNKAPWILEKREGDPNGITGPLDMISGGKKGWSMLAAKTPQPQTAEELLEVMKRQVARCMGSTRGTSKSFRAADMKSIQHKLAMKRKRGGF